MENNYSKKRKSKQQIEYENHLFLMRNEKELIKNIVTKRDMLYLYEDIFN
jgi:hypothetical protein